jgi:hypothetical protein
MTSSACRPQAGMRAARHAPTARPINDAIRDVATTRSLALVELTGLVAAGTTELTTEQNRAVADAFIAAYRRS